MTKIFLKLVKTINHRSKKLNKPCSTRNMEKTAPRQIIIKLLKNSDHEKNF